MTVLNLPSSPASSDVVKNVLDFGADNSANASGTGEVDSTAAIQAAVDEAVAEGGGIVYLPAGGYSVSEILRLGEGIAFVGVSPGGDVENGTGTRLYARDETKSIIHITGIRINGLVIQNLKFFGTGKGTASDAATRALATGRCGIHIHDLINAGSHCTFRNLFFDSFPKHGFCLGNMGINSGAGIGDVDANGVLDNGEANDIQMSEFSNIHTTNIRDHHIYLRNATPSNQYSNIFQVDALSYTTSPADKAQLGGSYTMDGGAYGLCIMQGSGSIRGLNISGYNGFYYHQGDGIDIYSGYAERWNGTAIFTRVSLSIHDFKWSPRAEDTARHKAIYLGNAAAAIAMHRCYADGTTEYVNSEPYHGSADGIQVRAYESFPRKYRGPSGTMNFIGASNRFFFDHVDNIGGSFIAGDEAVLISTVYNAPGLWHRYKCHTAGTNSLVFRPAEAMPGYYTHNVAGGAITPFRVDQLAAVAVTTPSGGTLTIHAPTPPPSIALATGWRLGFELTGGGSACTVAFDAASNGDYHLQGWTMPTVATGQRYVVWFEYSSANQRWNRIPQT